MKDWKYFWRFCDILCYVDSLSSFFSNSNTHSSIFPFFLTKYLYDTWIFFIVLRTISIRMALSFFSNHWSRIVFSQLPPVFLERSFLCTVFAGGDGEHRSVDWAGCPSNQLPGLGNLPAQGDPTTDPETHPNCSSSPAWRTPLPNPSSTTPGLEVLTLQARGGASRHYYFSLRPYPSPSFRYTLLVLLSRLPNSHTFVVPYPHQ